MAKQHLGPRVQPVTREFYEAVFDTINAGAEYVLEMFPDLYRGTLARELKGRFTAPELSAIIDTVNSLFLLPQIAGTHLPPDVSDGIALEGLDKKWGFDGPRMMEKLRTLTLFQGAVLEIWAKSFWAQHDRAGARSLEIWVEQLT